MIVPAMKYNRARFKFLNYYQPTSSSKLTLENSIHWSCLNPNIAEFSSLMVYKKNVNPSNQPYSNNVVNNEKKCTK